MASTSSPYVQTISSDPSIHSNIKSESTTENFVEVHEYMDKLETLHNLHNTTHDEIDQLTQRLHNLPHPLPKIEVDKSLQQLFAVIHVNIVYNNILFQIYDVPSTSQQSESQPNVGPNITIQPDSNQTIPPLNDENLITILQPATEITQNRPHICTCFGDK